MNIEDEIFLNNAPLPESETAVILHLCDEEQEVKGSKLLQEEGLEGKITFDPGRCLIFSTPPVMSAVSGPPSTPDGDLWDLYLVVIPFTLHEAPGESYYEKVVFFVKLDDTHINALDLFPRYVGDRGAADKTYMLAPNIKISEIEDSLSASGRPIRFASLHPTITAFGEGGNRFFWTYEGFQEQRKVIPETKYALVVLQVPHGVLSISGTIKYELKVVTQWHGIWTRKKWPTSALPIHWKLNAAPLIVTERIQTRPEDEAAGSIPGALRQHIFISYSHKDKKWLDKLLTILKPLERQGLVKTWSDTLIPPGAKRREEINNALASAKIALLLVTPDFLASDFVANHELPLLLEAAEKEGLIILWVAVRHSLYKAIWIADYQAVNNPSRPLDSLTSSKVNQELVLIAEKVKGVYET